MDTFIKDIFSGLTDLFYPPRCIICNSWQGGWLCEKCIFNIDDGVLPFCFNCKKEFSFIPDFCPVCNSTEILFSFGYYEGILREAICELKYNRKIVLAIPLGELLSKKFLSYFKPGDIDIILPVPLHHNKKTSRGFNQVEKFIRVFSSKTSMKYTFDVLERIKNTEPQSSLSPDKRKENIRGAFRVIKPELIKNKNILLVDDILTSGSTMRECADLISSFSGRIYFMVLALSQKSQDLEKEF